MIQCTFAARLTGTDLHGISALIATTIRSKQLWLETLQKLGNVFEYGICSTRRCTRSQLLQIWQHNRSSQLHHVDVLFVFVVVAREKRKPPSNSVCFALLWWFLHDTVIHVPII